MKKPLPTGDQPFTYTRDGDVMVFEFPNPNSTEESPLPPITGKVAIVGEELDLYTQRSSFAKRVAAAY